MNLNFDLNSDELVEVFDELPLWSAPFGLKLFDKIRLRRQIKILDIGFGTGFPLIELAMRSGETCSIYGIDPWKAAIKRTSKKINQYGIKNIQIVEAAAEQIPLKDNSIDLIVSNNGLNNARNLDEALAECSRIIKPGGQFVQSFNLDKTMIEFYEAMEKLLFELEMNLEIQKLKNHIYEKRKPLDEIIKKIEKNGFSIKEIDHDKFEYKFINGTAMLNHHFIKLAFLDSWKKIIPVKEQEAIFSELENRMNQKAGLEGSLKLTVPFFVINTIKN